MKHDLKTCALPLKNPVSLQFPEVDWMILQHLAAAAMHSVLMVSTDPANAPHALIAQGIARALAPLSSIEGEHTRIADMAMLEATDHLALLKHAHAPIPTNK